MAGIRTRKSIAALEAEAAEPEVQALTTHDGVPLKRTLRPQPGLARHRRDHRRRHLRPDRRAAAAENAGPALMLSFVLAGVACAFAALCYAEFASMVPVAGSAYTYAYATLGELSPGSSAGTWSSNTRSARPPWPTAGPATWSRLLADFGSPSRLPSAARARRRPSIVADGSTVGSRSSSTCRRSLIVAARHRRCWSSASASRRASTRPWSGSSWRRRARHRRRRAHTSTATNWHPFIPPNTGTFGSSAGAAPARRRRDLLRLHRLRLGLDRRAGGEESAARHADRHPRLARDLHRALRRRRLVLTGMLPTSKLNVADPIAVGIEAAGVQPSVADHQIRH